MTREEAIEVYLGLINPNIKEAFEFFAPELADNDDERIREVLIDMVKRNTCFVGFPSQGQVLAYLEKQKEQKPAEWSEKDEEMIRCITERIESDIQYGDELIKAYGNQEISWLKSLRLQKHWKPTIQEIEAFENLLKGEFPNHIFPGATLSTLLNELKKLYYDGSIPIWKPSDDDERMIKTSITFLKDFAEKGYENAVECIDWLKSKLNGNTCK